ncbi:TlpA family protein disulfide reductase [Stigmatella erecta]|uniref:TlpA family protein disulfide reductase n=1 Tax=Stigmatella erecta TaxID=83460 RepID=UPI001FE5C28B|nr:TlpA disulfide reductase family protein [Stigmatella erecta]
MGLLSLPGCQSESLPAYVRLGGQAPALASAPPSRAWLVVFWASWCPPCREETPALVKLAEAPPEGLRVVVFSHDAHLQAVEAFLGGPPAAGLHLRLDEGHAVARAFGVDALPASILVVDGHLTARFSGARDWDSRAMRRLLERLLQERRPTGAASHIDVPPRPQ